MKINKTTILVCSFFTISSGISTTVIGLFAPQTVGFTTIQGIMSSVFTGFIVSLVVSTIGYFHERNVIIDRTDSNIQSLYINIYVISKEVEKTLQQIPYVARLEALPFKYMYDVSSLNIDFFKDMNISLFTPFFKNGKLGQIYKELQEFQRVVYNIRNISTSLYAQSLEYDNQLLTIRNNQLNGMNLNLNDSANLEAFKNTINVRTAKFHEYTTGQLFELEKIAKAFYLSKSRKQSWEDIKPVLLQQANIIMRG